VADTPNQGGPNYGQPTFPKVSCDNGPDGDMFMNYMDYTDDTAMGMFTTGQAARWPPAWPSPIQPDGERHTDGMSQPPAALFRRWVHVREEDHAGVRVYRPADRPLPPARGRGASSSARTAPSSTTFPARPTHPPARPDGGARTRQTASG
jgi:hypothetical protein